MTRTLPQNGNVAFLTGLFLINSITCILILSSLTFFFGGTISFWQFPLAVIISAVINYFAGKYLIITGNDVFKPMLLSILIIAASVAIAGYFYDVSYDGQAYHQEGIYQLKSGWNPYYSMLPDTVNQVMYVNHYSKGVELPQSAIYATLGHIETGKATNIMLLAAAFCLTLSLLYKTVNLSALKCTVLSLLITLNPIAVNQLLTYYVDGQLATLLLCLMIAGMLVIREPNRYNLLLLGSVIIITSNIKFTAVVYIALFVLAMLAWAIYIGKVPAAKKLFYTAFIGGLIGVGMVGYNPYVVNTVKYQHPFYPLMGKNKIDIISYNLPAGFDKKSGMEKLFISLFSHTGNITPVNGKVATLKIPFTLNKSDITNAPKVDTRIGGFGPLFSGILILSLVLIVLAYSAQADKKLFRHLLYTVVVLTLSALIIPESWWARYIPQLWFVPVIILLAAELSTASKAIKIIRPLLYAAIVLNITFSMISLGWNFLMTNLVDYQLAQLKAAHKTITVQWGSAKSNRVRFHEHGIPYLEANLDNRTDTRGVVRSDSKFVEPGVSSDLPKSFLVKWAEKFQTQEEKQ